MVHQKKLTNTLNRMFSLHPKLIDFDLTRLNLLMNKFGSPHNQLSNVIHIAGTNGKGSTSSHIECVLRGLGKKVGLYTSPHLVRFNERIRVNGIPITNQEIESFLKTSWMVNYNFY